MESKNKFFPGTFALISTFCIATLAVLSYFSYISSAPSEFSQSQFEIRPGDTVRQIGLTLEEKDIIRSADFFELYFKIFSESTQIKAGKYQITSPKNMEEISNILITGDVYEETVTLTFFEGQTAAAYGERASSMLDNFDQAKWQRLISSVEGKLFPDTYFVPAEYTTEQLFTLLTERHEQVLKELTEENKFDAGKDDLEDVIILASILEREANDETSMRTVAGIFSNRIKIDMPLQADATIEYVLETPLGELPPGRLAQNLREVDSPYNTYLNTDLPPTPIGNPGRQALASVLNPIESDYLFYITGNDGEFYYAKTYNQHLINIERHLR